MSTLTYNGVVLSTISTTQFAQEAQYDASHTDYLRTKITLTVRAIINQECLPSTGGETPVETMNRIRKKLMTQNRQLVYEVNGKELIRNPANGISEDVFHGPFPIRCNILSLPEETFLLEYQIETYLVECDSEQTTPLAYISNRWSETDSIDEDFLTTREIKGLIIFRADAINSKKFNNDKGNKGADFYRTFKDPYLIPPQLAVKNNFMRKKMDFVVSEDGLTLLYTIQDVEVYVMPPKGCTRFTCDHTVTTFVGAVWQDSINVKVWGNALATKSTLMAAAAAVINGQIDLSSQKLLKGGAWRFGISENTVEVKIDTFKNGKADDKTVAGIVLPVKPGDLQKLDYLFFKGGTPGKRSTDDNPTPNPGMRGSANLAMILFDKYLSLCNSGSPALVSSTGDTIDLGVTAETTITTASTASFALDTASTKFTTASLPGIYTEYSCEIEYRLQGSSSGMLAHMAYMDTSLTKSAIIPLAQPLMTKIVKYNAERAINPPDIPASATSNTNNKLLSYTTKPLNISVAGDGETPIYHISGVNVFAVVDWTVENSLLGGASPYLNIPFNQTSSGNPVLGLAENPYTPGGQSNIAVI